MTVITIDGPAGVGKGTLAKKLAATLNAQYLDTGLLYRAVAAKCIASGIVLEQAHTVATALSPDDLERDDLRLPTTTALSSKVAADPAVRQALLEWQQIFARNANFTILDGRDTGTIVCPQADAKLFLTASAEERAKRRTLELPDANYPQVLADIKERDHRDMTRSTAPLKPADDAYILDTNNKTINAVFNEAHTHIKRCLNLS